MKKGKGKGRGTGKGTKPKKVISKVKGKKLKPFYAYNTWAFYRALSLKKVGVLNPKHKNYKERYKANVNRDKYNEEKEIFIKKQLSKILIQKFNKYKRQGEKVKEEVRNVITKRLKELGYSKELITQILTQKNILKSIYEFQKTAEDKRIVRKEIRVTKNKVYDKETKKTYTKSQYNRKLAIERYWFMIKSLSKSLGISIKETRELYKLGGSEFFKVLQEKIDSPDLGYATPEELKAYWGNVKDIAKETGLSTPEVRAILKINPSHFNHLK